MQVALYARVSTPNQQQEGTIASQVQSLHLYIRQHEWSLLPTHEYIDEGVSGARLDRPALDRLRDCAHRGEFDAVVVLSPDRLARNYAYQWLLIEEFEKLQVQWIFLHNPFGDTPQGKLLTQMQGMMAEYERAQIHERTRRGRLEKARRGEFMPWAYHCYGYRYLPKRHGCVPQVVSNLEEAEVVRHLYQAVVEEHMSCRQLTKRLNAERIPTPSGKNQVWQAATVRNILTNRVYTGRARYNYRQPALPKYRKGADAQLHGHKTGRSYRSPSEWVESEAPAIIPVELFEKAQLQLHRNAEVARRLYQPTSRRYLLRTLVKCGECGLGMTGIHQHSKCKKYDYLYYVCRGQSPLTCGRIAKCASHRVRADRLDAVVWKSLSELLQTPTLLPQLHVSWTQTKQHMVTALTAQQEQLRQRKQRVERQSERLLDAYQAEIITLSELQLRRGKLQEEIHRLGQDIEQFARSRSEALHWQQIIEHADCFRHLLGENLERLSFTDRQTVMQCLIKKVVVTGEHVDIYYIFPFDQAPQVYNSSTQPPEGTPGHFYWLRLADLNLLAVGVMSFDITRCECQIVRPPGAAAVFDHQDRMGDAAEFSLRVSIALGPRRPERMVTNLSVTLEAHHIVPPPAVKQIENLPGRIPAITQHIRGLQPPAPRLPQQPDR
jgi:site-specific DNA recombinase